MHQLYAHLHLDTFPRLSLNICLAFYFEQELQRSHFKLARGKNGPEIRNNGTVLTFTGTGRQSGRLQKRRFPINARTVQRK